MHSGSHFNHFRLQGSYINASKTCMVLNFGSYLARLALNHYFKCWHTWGLAFSGSLERESTSNLFLDSRSICLLVILLQGNTWSSRWLKVSASFLSEAGALKEACVQHIEVQQPSQTAALKVLKLVARQVHKKISEILWISLSVCANWGIVSQVD